MRVLFIFVSLVLCGLGRQAIADPGRETHADSLTSRVWRVRDGLPQDAIQAVAQTADGYLWIGTTAGLVRFDGNTFRTYRHTEVPELVDDNVLTLYCPDGVTLWIGTEGGGLVRLYAGVFQRFGTKQGLTNGYVRALYNDANHSLWIGTDRGLFRLRAGHVSRIDSTSSVRSINVYSIAEDSLGRVLVGCTDDLDTMGIFAFSVKAQLLSKYRVPATVGDRRVRVLHMSSDGSLWIAAGHELWRWRRGYAGDLFSRSGFVHLQGTTSMVPTRPITINAIADGPLGALWLATSNAGVLRMTGAGKVQPYRSSDVLSDDNVLAIYAEQEGMLWAGTANGLTALHSAAAKVLTDAAGSAISVRSIYQQRNGQIFVISSGDRLYSVEHGMLQPACLQGVPCDIALRTFIQDSMKRLWVGTAGQGLFVVGRQGVQHYADMDLVRAFAEAPDGTMWVGLDSGLTQVSDRILKHINGEGGLGSDSIRAMMFDRDGSLWVGTDEGVAKLDSGNIVPSAISTQLRGKKVYALLQDDQGRMYFGTRGNGLWTCLGQQVNHFGLAGGLPSDSILGLLLDGSGRLWLSSDSGIFSVRLADLTDASHHDLPVRIVGASEGAHASQMNAEVQPSAWRAQDGALWFASSSGPVRVEAEALRESKAFPTLVQEVWSEGKRLDWLPGQQLVLKPSQPNFEIRYTAVNLETPERVHFHYQLQGFDKAPVDAGGRRTAFYTNVPPSRYTFNVEAFDSDQKTRVSSFSLSIIRLPAWYQTWWSYTLLCVMVLLAVAAGYWMRLRTIKKRFAAVLDERVRLAREMHDTLIQGCVGVSALLEAAASTFDSAPPASRDVLNKARFQIHETVEEARLSVWNLRHGKDGQDLIEAIRKLALQYAGEDVVLSVQSELDSLSISDRKLHEMLALSREALNNAVQHSRAAGITVQVSATDRFMSISVADDGQGFNPEAEHYMHYGLVGMQERVDAMRGTLFVTSAPGEGSCVSITVPLHDKSD